MKPGKTLALAAMLCGGTGLGLGSSMFCEGRARAAEAVGIERIVAVVGNEIVLLSELRERAQQMQQSLDDQASADARRQFDKQMRTLLDRMVDDVLVLQQASDLKLTVEAAEIDRAMDEVKKANNLSDEQFLEALKEQGFNETAYRRDLRKQIMRMKVLNTAVRSRISISDEDLKNLYDQSARQAGSHPQAHVRHVLVKVAAGAPPSEVEARRRVAERVIAEVKAGADFADLARRLSDDEVTKDEGGDLGWITEGEGLAEVVDHALFQMQKPDELAGPLRTERGFEVLQLLERKDGDVRPFAEVKDQLRQQLYQQQLEKQTQLWLSELRKRTHVDVRY